MTLPPAPPPERRLLGIALRSGGTISFAFMAALLKTASDRGVATPEMIFYRNLGALPVVTGWILLGPGLAAVRSRRPLSHLTRSTIGLISMFLTFGALALLPLGEATTLTYSAPILATILSGLVLGEEIGARRWAAVAVGFVGVLLVVQPGGGGRLPAIGLAVGVLAAVGQACVMITLRTISRTEGTAAIVFWFTSGLTLAGLAMLPVFGRAHEPATYAILLGAGMFGGMGQLGMTASLRFAPVAVVVPFDYLQIVCAMLIGWIAFADAPLKSTLAGALLIAASGIYTAYREHQRGRLHNEAAATALE